MKRIRKIARPIICMARLLDAFLVQHAKAVTVVDTISATVIFYLLPFLECFWHEIGDTPNIFDHKQIVCPDLMRPWSEKTGLGKITIVIRI